MIRKLLVSVLFGLAASFSIENIDFKDNVSFSLPPTWDPQSRTVYYIGDHGIVQYDYSKRKISNFVTKNFASETPRFIIPIDSKRLLLQTLGELILISRKKNFFRYIEDDIVISVKSKKRILTSKVKCDSKGRLLLVTYDDEIKGHITLWKFEEGFLKKLKTLGPVPHYEFIWNENEDKIYFTGGSSNKTFIYEYKYNIEDGSVGEQKVLIEIEGTMFGIHALVGGNLLLEDFFQPVLYEVNVSTLEIQESIRIPHSQNSYLQSTFVGDKMEQIFANVLSFDGNYPVDNLIISDLDFKGIPPQKCNFKNIL